jgi:hypothetical protein
MALAILAFAALTLLVWSMHLVPGLLAIFALISSVLGLWAISFYIGAHK